jgi:hypothetical protein
MAYAAARRTAFLALACQTTEVRALQAAYSLAEPDDRESRMHAVNEARHEWDRLFLAYQATLHRKLL